MDLRLAGVSHTYGETEVLRDINLDIPSGQIVCIVGPSGCGKSTLLRMLGGLEQPTSGEVLQLGTPPAGCLNPLTYVFQDFALLDYLSARQNILYPYRITPALTLDAAARERAEALATACGIGDKLDRHPTALSQGEQQRVAICRALVTQPRLILSDEATGNLDPASKTRILDLLFEQAGEAGAAVLAVTHDHELLPRFERVLDFAQFREEATA